jgi:hypothetical protein
MFNENKGGRLAFLTDIQLFDLITSGKNSFQLKLLIKYAFVFKVIIFDY